MCRSEPNKQKEDECSRQRDSMSKSPKGKWEMCHLQEFRETLHGGWKGVWGKGGLRDEGLGVGRKLGPGHGGLGQPNEAALCLLL